MEKYSYRNIQLENNRFAVSIIFLDKLGGVYTPPNFLRYIGDYGLRFPIYGVCRGDSPLPLSGRCSGCFAAVEGNLGFPRENKLPIGNFVQHISIVAYIKYDVAYPTRNIYA